MANGDDSVEKNARHPGHSLCYLGCIVDMI